jgi:hypothetical protein
MIRRINHTGRRRILREQVRITVDDQRKPVTFTAELTLDSHKFNADARVIIVAYRGSGGLWMPFDWGRVAALRKPPTATLNDVDSVDGLLFRVHVVAVHEPHKILGEADKLPFKLVGEAPSRITPLIKTRSADLAELVWDVDFDAEPPELRINRALGNWSVVAHDKAFRAVVYPALLREVLVRVLLIDEWSGDADDDDWRAKWIKFGRKLAPGYGEPFADKKEQYEFIESAVQSLASQIHAREMFMRHLNPEET